MMVSTIQLFFRCAVWIFCLLLIDYTQANDLDRTHTCCSICCLPSSYHITLYTLNPNPFFALFCIRLIPFSHVSYSCLHPLSWKIEKSHCLVATRLIDKFIPIIVLISDKHNALSTGFRYNNPAILYLTMNHAPHSVFLYCVRDIILI